MGASSDGAHQDGGDQRGEPDSVPLAASVRPFGRADAVVNVADPIPPLCVKVWLKAALTVPLVVAGFVTVMVWQPMTSG